MDDIMTNDDNKLGRLIRAARLAKKMTQAEAARAAGWQSRQAWDVIESGRQSPSDKTICRMAAAVGANAGEWAAAQKRAAESR